MADVEQIEASDITFTSSGNMGNLVKEEMTLKEYNAHIIRHFLDKYPKNIAKTAEILDIGKSTIYRLLQNEEI